MFCSFNVSLPTFYAGQDGHEFLCSRPEHSGIQLCAHVPDARDQHTRAQCNLTLADWELLARELEADRVASCLFLPHRPSRLEVTSSVHYSYSYNHSATATARVRDVETSTTSGRTTGFSVECSATQPVATLHVLFHATTMAALNASVAAAPDSLRRVLLSDRSAAVEWRRTGGHNWNASAFALVDCVNWNRYYVDCNASAKNPFMGATSFDNIGLAWVAIFQVISMEGWSDILYLLQDAFRYVSHCHSLQAFHKYILHAFSLNTLGCE